MQQVRSVLGEGATYVTPSGVVDYYEILGVDDDASATEIKAAYRGLAKVGGRVGLSVGPFIVPGTELP